MSCTLLVLLRNNRSLPSIRQPPLPARNVLRSCLAGQGVRVSSSSPGGRGQKKGRWAWFGIPVSLGVTCLALLQLRRTLSREKRLASAGKGHYVHQDDPVTWQLFLYQKLPARAMSRVWGLWMDNEIPVWLRKPCLGLYVWLFGCKMEEAIVEDVSKYRSFSQLFVRRLKKGVRPINQDHPLVSPSDGKVLHFGRVEGGRVEQIKGVTYSLEKFLGPGIHSELGQNQTALHRVEQGSVGASGQQVVEGANATERGSVGVRKEKDTELYHIVLYLSPGDCHHFFSPVDWKADLRRHFSGELLTVAPWAARSMPGLFTLNERALLTGSWEHGYFSFSAVGAFNVGSIALDHDKTLRTNCKSHQKNDSHRDKPLGSSGSGVTLSKGDHLGCFRMGSSVVLIFEAPRDFQFLVEQGAKVRYGQALGTVTKRNLDGSVD